MRRAGIKLWTPPVPTPEQSTAAAGSLSTSVRPTGRATGPPPQDKIRVESIWSPAALPEYVSRVDVHYERVGTRNGLNKSVLGAIRSECSMHDYVCTYI